MEFENQDIRWKQRFQNFRRAFLLLRSAFDDQKIEELSDLEQEGIIHRFEYTFELGWKTFKDYLEYGGITLVEATPRRVIKECAARSIFDKAGVDPETYMEMMLARNALAHRYDFDFFKQVIVKIKEKYLQELEREYMFFLSQGLSEDD